MPRRHHILSSTFVNRKLLKIWVAFSKSSTKLPIVNRRKSVLGLFLLLQRSRVFANAIERAAMESSWIEDEETIREFVIESRENLERLDRDLVELEKHPTDSALLSSVFRTFHTIKGSCGFLAYAHLEQLTHQAENLLSQLRDGKRKLSSDLVSLILETVDATRKVLTTIEATGKEGDERFEDLIDRLQSTAQSPLNQSEQPAAQSETFEIAKPVPTAAEAQLPPKAATSEAPELKEPKFAPTGEVPGGEVSSEEEAAHGTAINDSSIRVGVVLLDKLMDLVGELVLTRNQILQTNLEREDASLNTSSQRLNLITTELQEHVMKTRMQPIRVVWGNLPRIVRDMAVALDKQIQLKMEGADTELDRTIIETIKDPLVHLIRNSCDHGIETPEVRLAAGKPAEGTMMLRAYHEGGQVTIEITDDGGGIDLERVREKALQNGVINREAAAKLGERDLINLIFMPGLSTARSITKISGRGVGMDVVKSQIEKIGGIIDVETRDGSGTTIKIRIPLTLAIIPGLIVTCSGERFVIPQVSLLELIQLDDEQDGKRIENLYGAPVFRRRGTLLPVVHLNDVLGLPVLDRKSSSMVVLQTEGRQFGLIVDSINDTQEIVVKPLGKQFKGLALYAGATIMGDGEIALILDVLGIGQSSGVLSKKQEQSEQTKAEVGSFEDEKQRLLLVKSGSFPRIAIPLSLVARLEEFSRDAIEFAGGGYVVQYRDKILPLVMLQSVLEPEARTNLESMNPVPVVVFNVGDQSVGVVVDSIVDVTEDSVSIRKQSRRRGLLGSAVVGKFVTDFLDLDSVIAASKEDWLHANPGRGERARVLLIGGAPFSRELLRGVLEMSGYTVHDAESQREAIQRINAESVQAVVAVISQSQDVSNPIALSKAMASAQLRIPILGVIDNPGDIDGARLIEAGMSGSWSRFDREGLIDGLGRAIAARRAAEEAELVTEVA